jgi:hypothetical protein
MLGTVPESHTDNFFFSSNLKLEEAGRLRVIILSVICLLDPCRTLVFFVF